MSFYAQYNASDGTLRWARGDKVQLSPHFWGVEFQCGCGRCISQQVSTDLISRLERLRQIVGHPLVITSGYRCSAWQQKLKKDGKQTAKLLSQHELGKAADIAFTDVSSALAVAKQLFRSVGVAKTFLHLDTRDDKERIWTYA